MSKAPAPLCDWPCNRPTLSGSGRCYQHEGKVKPSVATTLRPQIPMTGLLTDFGNALNNGQLRLMHQPKYDARTGEMVGAESLVRWRHPVLGEVPPDAFVPLVEADEELGEAFAAWAFAEAAATSTRLGGRPATLSVNLSAAVLQREGAAESLIEAVHDAGGDPARLIIEVTETAEVHDWVTSVDNAMRLREAGFRLSVDDLGSGHATTEYVEHLQPYEAKVDREVVARGGEELAALIARCRELNASVTAEGVEDEETVIMLTEMGVDTLQGYHLSRPLEEHAFSELLR